MSTSRPSYTVYIGDLPKVATRDELFDKFKAIDGLYDLKVNVSKSKHNTKYAFAFYNTPDACEEAIKRYNHVKIHGVPMRVMYTRPYKNIGQQSGANIFVKGLPKNYASKDFGDLFTVIGPVVSFKITHNANGDSLGYGYVQFDKEKDAQLAILTLDAHTIGENTLRVATFMPRGNRKSIFNLKISGFRDWDEAKLRSVFSRFGEIASARVFCGGVNHFGFVSFKEERCGLDALENMNELEIDGYKLIVSRHYNRLDRNLHLVNLQRDPTSVTNLYVKNFDKNTTDEDFKNLFLSFGPLRNSKIERDNGASRGFGYVNFKNHEDADKAVKELNGSDKLTSTNKSKKLHVAFFQYKCDRAPQTTTRKEPQPVPANQTMMRPPPNQEMMARFYESRGQNRLMPGQFQHQMQGFPPSMLRPPFTFMPSQVPHMANYEIRSNMIKRLRNSKLSSQFPEEDIVRVLDRASADKISSFVDMNNLSEYIGNEIAGSQRNH